MYEVKLEKDTSSGGKYKSSPQAAPNGEINVSTFSDATDTYKGFKHDLGGTNKNINSITIHGHAIEGITELNNGGTITGKRYAFVYFKGGSNDPNNERPLLICLAQQDTQADPNNIWYKRVKKSDTYTWENGGAEYNSIIPGGSNGRTIDGNLKNELGIINGAVSGDPGYPPPGITVKLDYAAKGTGATDTIKYWTGTIQVTVTQISGSTYKGYKHSVGQGNAINKVKIHNTEISEINETALQNKQFVFVYFAKIDTDLQKPYLICLSQTGGQSKDNKWYSRTRTGGQNTWSTHPKLTATDDPNNISGLENQLTTIKKAPELADDQGYTPSGSTVDIDVSVTPTEQTPEKGALYGSGSSQITIERTNGTATGQVPLNYVRYKHSPADPSKTPTFTLSSVKYNDQVLTGIHKATYPRTLRITE